MSQYSTVKFPENIWQVYPSFMNPTWTNYGYAAELLSVSKCNMVHMVSFSHKHIQSLNGNEKKGIEGKSNF